jgi:excisionase family DNA binding protein
MQREDRWMDIRKTARYISMSVGFVRKAVRNKSIPFTRIGSKALRFDRDALDEWLAAQGRGGELAYRKN